MTNCFGIKSYADGGHYVGEWKDGNSEGQGTYTDADGTKYVGEWKNGNYNGQGTLTYADGDKYFGKWMGGQKHGQGVFTYHNGMVKEGIWAKGKFLYAEKPSVTSAITSKKPLIKPVPKVVSSGLPTCSGSSRYWSNCVGNRTYSTGNIYVGEFRTGKLHGQGTMIYTDGEKYVGEYRNDQRHGLGTITYTDGTEKGGIWDNGWLKTANKTSPTVIAAKP